MTTPYGAPEWAASQAAPDVTVNEQARRVQAGGNHYVVADKDLTSAPGSCADGATYIVATAGGAWSAGAAKDLATAVGVNAANGWYFRTPVEGVTAYAQDENLLYRYNGSAWASVPAGTGDLLSTNNLSDLASAGTARTNLGLVPGTDVQAYDADLTAIAALSGTNTLYYRSAANTWSAVTIGGNLSFSGGTLNAVGAGSGDVVGPGSSVAGHVAVFDGTTGKLLKDGGVANMANGGIITPTATPATNEIGYLGTPVDTSLDSGAVAPALVDCGKTFYHTDANARTFTIPANGSVAFPVGTILAIEQGPSAANVTIAITSDTLRWGSSTGSRTLAANGGCSIQKVSSTVWRIRGEGLT